MKITFAYLVGSLLTMTGLAPAAPAADDKAAWLAARPMVIDFEAVGNKFPIFHQADSMDPATYNYTQMYGAGIDSRRRFGPTCFVDGMYHKPAWVRFHDSVLNYNHLRKNKLPAEEFKIIIFQRHGQGWHNVAEDKYGTPAWNCYWAQQEGDGEMKWSDPVLSPQGEQECRTLNEWYKMWFGNPDNRTQYIDETLGVPMFDSYYVSPLTRAIQTANLAFGDIEFPDTRPYKPIVKELLREDISTHTCDRRSNKSEIAAKFPNVQFEDGFTEEDELWDAENGETRAEGEARARAVLEDIFRSDRSTWISITTHGGMIRNMLKVLQHRPFPIKTGQILPVYVKASLQWPKEEGGEPGRGAGDEKESEESKEQDAKAESQRQDMEDEAWSKYASAVVEAGGKEPERPQTTTYGENEVKGEKTCASLPVVTSIEGTGCICTPPPTTTSSMKASSSSSAVKSGAKPSQTSRGLSEAARPSETK